MSMVENFKSIVKTVQEIDNIELYKKILEMQSDAMSIMEENISLKEENRRLQDQLKARENLVFENEMYYLRNNENEEKTGPFCTRCWDKEDRLIRMLKHDPGYGIIYKRCPECKNQIEVGEYTPNLLL